jgi:hypothetical protein
MRSISTLVLCAAFALAPLSAFAHGTKGHQNLKVLRQQNHRKLDAGMKLLTKGLGVKCGTCHVKGEYDRDDLPAKIAARDFMTQTIGVKDPAQRSEALDELLLALDLERPKDEAKVWKAVRTFQKKRRAE